MSYNFTAWPEIEWEQWKDTAETLHMYLQIVGKTRLALMPVQNHWWSIPLYLTARGLSTSPMPIAEGDSLDIEFDFIDHCLVFRSSRGDIQRMALLPKPVKAFHSEYMQMLARFGITTHLDPLPVEVANPIRFDQDDEHESYDGDAVSRFWHGLRLADFIFKRFSTTFYGKISPVHFFWGSMDLAVTRFSGRRAPPRSDGDPVQAEAYSHEVISAGFWPGNGGYGQAAFYTYAAPVPSGLSEASIADPGVFNKQMGEFILNYRDVIRAPKPIDTVMAFLESTYSACAQAAEWNREHLDRSEAYVKRSRSRLG